MPKVEIRLIEGDHTVEQKAAFMKRATQDLVDILKCPIKDVRVSIIEYKPENASKGGVSILELDRQVANR